LKAALVMFLLRATTSALHRCRCRRSGQLPLHTDGCTRLSYQLLC
jgi:hypothetical protein